MDDANYVMRQTVLIAPTLLFISLIVFPFSYLLQGDPVDRLFGSAGITLDERMRASIRAEYGLDRPLTEQFGDWVEGLLRGDLTVGPEQEAPTRTIGSALQRSLERMAAAIVLAIILAAVVGPILAMRPGSLLDSVIRTLPGESARPGKLWLAAFLLIGWPAVLTVSVGPLWGSSPVTVGDMTLGATAIPTLTLILWPYQFLFLHFGGELIAIDLIASLLLALLIVGGVTRLVRDGALEVLRADESLLDLERRLTAYWTVTWRTLRKAAPPVLAMVTLLAPSLAVASATLELFLGRAGLVPLVLGALLLREMTVVWSVVLLGAALLMLVKLAGDLLSVYADSRLRRA